MRVASSLINDLSELDGLDRINTDDETSFIVRFEHEITLRNSNLPNNLSVPEIKSMQPPPRFCRSQLKSSSVPHINVLFTNADQMTSSKFTELKSRINRHKPLLLAVSEVKTKNPKDRTTLDYNIPGYSLHPVNLETRTGRGMIVYTHTSLDKSVIQINPDTSFGEVCLLEIKLRGGDIMLFGSFYRSPTLTDTSDKNNENLNNHKTNQSQNRNTVTSAS